MIRAIMAVDDSGGVSKNGSMPWPKNSGDLSWFKQNTLNQVVIMGRLTWIDSMIPTPLYNRINILVTNKSPLLYPGAQDYISGNIENIEDQSVKAALVRVGGSQLEFIQPTDPDGPIAKFIDDRGEAVHHLCFEVENLDQKLENLDDLGYRMIDKKSRDGLSGQIGFIHPKSTRGVLIELVDQDKARR